MIGSKMRLMGMVGVAYSFSHPVLPEYWGADFTHWAILEGEKELDIIAKYNSDHTSNWAYKILEALF